MTLGRTTGGFVVLEGGEGSGKSTQAALLGSDRQRRCAGLQIVVIVTVGLLGERLVHAVLPV